MSTALTHPATMPATSEWNMIVAQADVLAQTEIVPKAFQGRAHDIIAAALLGRSVGLDPMLSLQYIHVIEGKPSLSAEAMVALVRKAGHVIQIVKLDDDGAIARGVRADNGETAEFEFTRAHAQAAELLSKGVWQAYFRSMAWARAVSQLCRMLFPDVIMGMSYVPEELGADVEGDGTPIGAEVRAAQLPEGLREQIEGGVIIEGEAVEIPNTVAETPAAFTADTQLAMPGTPAAATDTGLAMPKPPPPKTPEQLHIDEGRKLFPKGWPAAGLTGDSKGKPPHEVTVDDLDWLISKSDPNHPQYGAKNKAQADWCRTEIHRRDVASGQVATEAAPIAATPGRDKPRVRKTGAADRCSTCDGYGDGQNGAGEWVTCPTCNGAGSPAVSVDPGANPVGSLLDMAGEAVTDVEVIGERVPCPACGGEGKTPFIDPCSTCHGSGDADGPVGEPEGSKGIPSFGYTYDRWKPENLADAPALSADVTFHLRAALVAAQVQPTEADAMASINQVLKDHREKGKPFTNATAFEYMRAILPRVMAAKANG